MPNSACAVFSLGRRVAQAQLMGVALMMMTMAIKQAVKLNPIFSISVKSLVTCPSQEVSKMK